jgi:transposase
MMVCWVFAGCFIAKMLVLAMDLSGGLARLSTDPTLPKWIAEVADRLVKEAQKTARLNADLHTVNIKIQALTLELAHHRRMRFGAKAEAFSAEQRDLFQETWEADLAELKAKVDAEVEVDAPKKSAHVPAVSRCPITSNAW